MSRRLLSSKRDFAIGVAASVLLASFGLFIGVTFYTNERLSRECGQLVEEKLQLSSELQEMKKLNGDLLEQKELIEYNLKDVQLTVKLLEDEINYLWNLIESN